MRDHHEYGSGVKSNRVNQSTLISSQAAPFLPPGEDTKPPYLAHSIRAIVGRKKKEGEIEVILNVPIIG